MFEASAAVCVRAADSSAYVQDGLVAQWDGRDNAGRGRHGALAGDFQGLNIPWDGTGTNLCTFVLATGPASQVRRDGARVAALNRFKVDCGDAVCRIGSLGGQWAGIRGRAKVFSIRVYGRTLSHAEREWNLAVDRMRFLCRPGVHTAIVVR